LKIQGPGFLTNC